MQPNRFESIGAFLPTTVVSTRELLDRMPYKPPIDLQEITGIKNRRVHDKREASFESSFVLAMKAATDCLSRSSYRAQDLDVIISGSISRVRGEKLSQFEPSFALFLKRGLGADNATFFDVSNACGGMMTGVLALDRMIKAGIVRNGMVVSGECITPIAETAVEEIQEPFDPQFGSLTVGDSGAAVILDGKGTDGDQIHYVEMLTCSEFSRLCIGKPSDQKAHNYALYTNNQEMHKEERVQMWPRFQSDFLAKRGSSFADEKYDYIVHHQVGTRAIKNFSRYGGKVFNTEMPESLQVVEEYGNTASTSHYVVLHEHLKQKKLRKGAKILLVPAASGLVTGCLAATISELEV